MNRVYLSYDDLLAWEAMGWPARVRLLAERTALACLRGAVAAVLILAVL